MARGVHQLLGQGGWRIKVPRNVNHLLDNVSWVTAPNLHTILLVELSLHVVHNDRVVDDVLSAAVILKNLFVFFQSRVFKVDFVANAPKERLIHEFLRLEIGRKNNQSIKW